MALALNPTTRQADIGLAAVLVGVAIWAYFEAGNYPGFSGAYPQVIAVLLAAASVILLVRALRQVRREDQPRLFINTGRFVLGLAVLVLYVFGIDLVGYIIPSIVVGIAVPLLLGFRNLPLAMAVTFGTLAAILVIFVAVLGRPLPPDVFDGLLEMLR